LDVSKLLFPSVKTLNDHDLRREVEGLYVEVVKSGYQPTHVVGIATGGAYLSELLRDILPVGTDGPVFLKVRCQRPSTREKRKLRLDRILRRLPYLITDVMRIIEHTVRQWRSTRVSSNSSLSVTELNETAAIDYSAFNRVLILDDAADTGVTLATVEKYLQQRCPPGTQIRTAVLSKTGVRLLRNPDYQVFDGVLLRFPWSFDFHG
jgi:uncharacterized protein